MTRTAPRGTRNNEEIIATEGGKRLGRTLSFDQTDNSTRSAGNHVGRRSRHKNDPATGSSEQLTSYKSDT
jgi:hypothetical protein